MRLDPVQFASFYEGGQNGPVLCPGLVTREETVLATDCDGPDSAFDGVVIHLDPPVGEEQDQPTPVFYDVFERLTSWG